MRKKIKLAGDRASSILDLEMLRSIDAELTAAELKIAEILQEECDSTECLLTPERSRIVENNWWP